MALPRGRTIHWRPPKMSHDFLLQAVFESYIDGILILNDSGAVLSANRSAREICQKLVAGGLEASRVPPQIWRICQIMIDTSDLYDDQLVIIDDVIETDDSHSVRVRVRWFKVDGVERPCLHVSLEDRLQSAQKMAIAERARYGLTAREAEVWLLRQVGCTYKAIGVRLHITIDTVKKHVRNIHAKRDAFQWAQD